ncbi:MAG: glycosyltransferase family 2 protein [Anaerolineales bacterium]|nr:glycosyltransferase family 2 protein [Anaerolineales bacterium]
MQEHSLTIIIPGYNEGQKVQQQIQLILASKPDWVERIIFVDDGSADGTGDFAQKAGAEVIRHSANRGYGAALKTGIRAATTSHVATIDSDGQHNFADLVRMWELAAHNEMVVGNRQSHLKSGLWRLPGKWLIGKMANYLTRTKIPDVNSGLRIIHRETALRYLHLCPQGFSFSTTITVTFISRGYKVAYLPIHVEKRMGKSSVTISTGFEALLLVLRLASLFEPLRIFVPISLILGLAGLAWSVPYAFAGRGISIGALLAFVASILLFSIGLISDQISQLRLEKYE